jgi:hypothetical protein
MRTEVDPPQEWKEIFNEVWRQERDYFFEPSMNGVDWPKIRDQYAQLLPYVADRYSLTYIMGQMIGELSNSHTYVAAAITRTCIQSTSACWARIMKPTQPAACTASRKSFPARTGMHIPALR